MDLSKKIQDFESALFRLKEAYQRALEEKSSEDFVFFRDSTIQRFEFTVEIFWKCLKTFLEEHEGIICRSPKSCIREYFSAGYLSEKDAKALLEMIDYRNLTSHTYHEEMAQTIFNRLSRYITPLEKVLSDLRSKSEISSV